MDFLGWWVVLVGGPIYYLIRPTISNGAPGSTWAIKASLVELQFSLYRPGRRSSRTDASDVLG